MDAERQARILAKARATPSTGMDPERQARILAKAQAEQPGALERFGSGLTRPLTSLIHGISDTDTAEDRAALQRARDEGGWAGAGGEIVGSMLMGAPIAAAAPATALGTGGAIAAYALIEALRQPFRGETRAGNAALSAAGGAIGAGMGPAVRAGGALTGKTMDKVLPRVRPSPEAESVKRLASQFGVDARLTPGQQAGAGLTRWVERGLHGLPGWQKGVRGLQEEALADWNLGMLRSVTPNGARTVTVPGHEGFKQAQRAWREAYRRVWGEPTDYLQMDPGWAQAFEFVRTRAPQAAREFLDRNPAVANATVQGRHLDAFDDKIRNFTTKMIRDGDFESADALKALRRYLADALPADRGKLLKVLDQQYAKFATMQTGAGYQSALDAGGLVHPADLLKASKRHGGTGQVARGQAPLQDEASTAGDVFEGLVGKRDAFNENVLKAGIGTAAAIEPTSLLATGGLAASGRALATEPVRRFLTRGTGSGVDALRRLNTPRLEHAGIGQIVEDALVPLRAQMQATQRTPVLSQVLRRGGPLAGAAIGGPDSSDDYLNRLLGAGL